MTETRELLISYAELAIISIRCRPCGAELVVNIADEKQHRVWGEGTQLICGVCREPFDSSLKIALVRFREWFELAKRSGTTPTFRVRLENEEN